MRSERTLTCLKRKRRYIILSWLITFGTSAGLFIYGFCTKWVGGGTEVAQHIKALLIIGLLSILPVLILSIMVKDKVKPTIRMLNIILAAYLVDNWFMYIVAAIMLIDTYIISAKIEKYKLAYITNKEIDKRE